jgi:hypothetical protein
LLRAPEFPLLLLALTQGQYLPLQSEREDLRALQQCLLNRFVNTRLLLRQKAKNQSKQD